MAEVSWTHQRRRLGRSNHFALMDSAATMTRTAKRALTVVLLILLFASGALGTYVWWISGALQSVVWETRDAGLRIQYVPGKAMSSLFVSEEFTAGSKREWVCIEPGATQRFIGSIAVPDPEELFERARIPRWHSHSAALCRFYPEANDSQKAEILGILEEDVPLSVGIVECLANLAALGEEAEDENTRRIRELVLATNNQ